MPAPSMDRIQFSDTEYRWYTNGDWTEMDGEAARAVLVEGQWRVRVFERGVVSHGLTETIADADLIVERRVAETLAREARWDEMEREAREAQKARQREIAQAGDKALQDLMKRLDRAKQAAANREVSHPSYGLSGARARDEAEIAGIEILIQNRKAELVEMEAEAA